MCDKGKNCTLYIIYNIMLLVQWQVTTLLVVARMKKGRKREKRNGGKGYEWMYTKKKWTKEMLYMLCERNATIFHLHFLF